MGPGRSRRPEPTGRARVPREGGPRRAGVIPVALAIAVAALAAPAQFGAVPIGPAPASAQDRSLQFESFHSEIDVLPSGDVIVTETLEPSFTGEWNGILRHLNRQHTTADGSAELLDVAFLGATADGTPLEYEVNPISRSVTEFRVWVPDARDRTARVTLRYRVRGAIRFFAPAGTDAPDDAARDATGDAVAGDVAGGSGPSQPYDELYWQVTGTEWEVPILRATAEVILPPGASPLQTAAYEGSYDSREAPEGEIRADDGALAGPGDGRIRVRFPPSGPLGPGSGYTVAAAWPAGHVAEPGGLERSAPVPLGYADPEASLGRGLDEAPFWAWLPILLPFAAFWIGYRAWDRRGRDPAERAIAVQWEPPGDLRPAEAGTLVDHQPHMHDIISTLVDLAVRGYLVIEERDRPGLLKFGKEYAFHLVRPRSEWGDLTGHERHFLDGLFKGSHAREALANLAEEGSFMDSILEAVAGPSAADSAPVGALESVLLSDLENRFYKEIPDIRNALLNQLVEKGHYLRRPDRARNAWLALAGVSFAVAFITMFVGVNLYGAAFVLLITAAVGAGASALILGVFGFIMPARTEQGARTREAALGFKRFLEKVETPRYRRMIRSPEQFEQYLPWAMAFRCEKKWAAAFDDMLAEPPDWYHGHGSFRPSSFASDLNTMASTASSTMSSSPSSSGSGGGGSVGGGSGGGGGGGF